MEERDLTATTKLLRILAHIIRDNAQPVRFIGISDIIFSQNLLCKAYGFRLISEAQRETARCL